MGMHLLGDIPTSWLQLERSNEIHVGAMSNCCQSKPVILVVVLTGGYRCLWKALHKQRYA